MPARPRRWPHTIHASSAIAAASFGNSVSGADSSTSLISTNSPLLSSAARRTECPFPRLTSFRNTRTPSNGGTAESAGAATFLSPQGRAVHLLEKVGLKDRLGHLPSELSGGEMQRVALCRALVTAPELVLADEPTGNLDAWTGAGILKILTELTSDEQKFALVMVTHSPEAAAICDRVLTLEDGVLK